MNIYKGKRIDGEAIVTVNGKELKLRLDLRSHSPTGFNWGYHGSGPAQLALAILAHEYDDDYAEYYYHDFKAEAVGNLRGDSWTLTSDQIEAAMLAIQFDQQPSRLVVVA